MRIQQEEKEDLVRKILSLLRDSDLTVSTEILANVFIELGVSSMETESYAGLSPALKEEIRVFFEGHGAG